MRIIFNKKEVAKMSKKDFLKQFDKYKKVVDLSKYYDNATKKSVKSDSK